MADVLAITDSRHFQEAVLEAPVPVLVDFTGEHCAPCRAQAPLLERLARQLEGRLRVVVVDADTLPDIAQAYGVRGLPTLVLIRGGEVVDMRVGLTPERKLQALVQPVL